MFYNNKTLSKAQSKYFKKALTNVVQMSDCSVEVTYEDFQPGVSDSPTKTVSGEVRCSVDKVDQFNIQRYPYGDISEGDTIFYIPNDGTFPEAPEGFDTFSNIRLEFQGQVYTSTREPIKRGFLNDDKMFISVAFSN